MRVGGLVAASTAALLVLIATAACTRDDGARRRARGRAPASTTAARVVAPAVPVASVAPSTIVAATPDVDTSGAANVSPVPAPEARAVCDSVAAVWRAIPRSEIKRVDSIVVAREVDDLRDRKRSYPSCTVAASRAEGLDSTMKLRRFWPARGWTEIWRLEADGPDGDVLTYGRGLLRCEVWQQWDGGDDSDSTYVPSPYYGETTVCWRHRMPIGVLDTLHEEP